MSKSQDLCHDGDVMAANSHLKMAEQLARQIVSDPLGSSTKRQLEGLDKRWSDAVATVKGQLQDLAKFLESDLPTFVVEPPLSLDANLIKADGARIARIIDKMPLEADKLGKLVRQLDAEGLAVEKKRDLREQALDLIHQYQRWIDEDPLFTAMRLNPFERQITARALYHALENLSYNVLVSTK